MQINRRWILYYGLMTVLLSSCALMRYTVIPQKDMGPNGGALVYIENRIPEYYEFVVTPGDKEWLFQVFAYDKTMKPKHSGSGGFVTLKFLDGNKNAFDLWCSEPWAWSKGIGHLENKAQLGAQKEFEAFVTVTHGRSQRRLKFSYPFK